jgi:hypothetical protein
MLLSRFVFRFLLAKENIRRRQAFKVINVYFADYQVNHPSSREEKTNPKESQSEKLVDVSRSEERKA